MGFQKIERFPDAEEIIANIPLSSSAKQIKENRQHEINDIITGESNKLLVIVGPCSAHDDNAVLDYVVRLAELQDHVRDKIVLVPRIYTNKPRTTGEGYKGMLHQPNPMLEANFLQGIYAVRKLHLKAIAESGLLSADEMLYPDNAPYLDDLLGYVAVGARSTENQQHRLTASGFNIPVGMKNPTSGYLSVMFNAIHSAQMAHEFILNGYIVKSDSNPLAHSILRGSVNKMGKFKPNYHYEDLLIAINLYEEANLRNKAIIIDVNHDNSGKNYHEQSRIVKEILWNRTNNPIIKQYVKGFMIESFLFGGRQDIDNSIYGKSITDPCLSWEDTKTLLYEIAEY